MEVSSEEIVQEKEESPKIIKLSKEENEELDELAQK